MQYPVIRTVLERNSCGSREGFQFGGVAKLSETPEELACFCLL
jgi:hypothetical protein